MIPLTLMVNVATVAPTVTAAGGSPVVVHRRRYLVPYPCLAGKRLRDADQLLRVTAARGDGPQPAHG